eukprot:COSAG02_NODE_774_length_17325_cov_322.794381_3_plen_79_part_00
MPKHVQCARFRGGRLFIVDLCQLLTDPILASAVLRQSQQPAPVPLISTGTFSHSVLEISISTSAGEIQEANLPDKTIL